MTAEQREMAVALLADALRAEVFGQERSAVPAGNGDAALAVGARGRQEGARRYVRGMVDLLAVLFAEGRPGAEGCLEAAREKVAAGRGSADA